MTRVLIGSLALLLWISTMADPKAEALYNKLVAQLKEVQSLTGNLEFKVGKRTVTKFTFKLLKPNYYQLVSEDQAYYSDGKTWWMYWPKQNQYMSRPANTSSMSVPFLTGLEGFTSPKRSPYPLGKLSTKSFLGMPCYAIPLLSSDMPEDYKITLYLHPKTNLPVGWQMEVGKAQTITGIYHNLRLNADLKPEQFAWKPPEGATEYKQPDYEENLIKVGEAAPKFTLKTPDGNTLNLADVLAKHKVTLINFWFYG